MLEFLVSIGYETVRYSWFVSALSVKYILVIQAIGLLNRENFSIENYLEQIQSTASYTVLGIITVGFILGIHQPEIELYLERTVQFVAFLYYAFLFWRY